MVTRHHPKCLFVASALGLLCCLSAQAADFGKFYVDGKPVSLVDTYACTEPDMLNEGKSITIVQFADGAIDKAAANAADEHCREVRHQREKKFSTLLELKIKYDGSFYNIQTYDANGTVSRSDGALKLKVNDGKRIEGSYASKRFDLHFALAVVGAAGK